MQKITKRNARIWSMLGMRRVLGQVINDLPALDDAFVFMTADVARYFGVEKFQNDFPQRLLDMGIAEQNMVGVAAGMAKEGRHVFAATYATFVTARVLDQVRVNLGYMGLNVKLVGVGGGLAEGDLSPTHMGLEDIANIRSIPNIAIVSPADGASVVKALYALAEYDGPAYLRLTGKVNTPMVYTEDFEFEIGKSHILKEGGDLALVATGTLVATALEVAEKLEAAGTRCTVVDMHTIKPLDEAVLNQLAAHPYLVTLEEHMVAGGMGSAIAEYYASKRTRPVQLMLGVENSYPMAGDYGDLLEACGLTAPQVLKRIEALLSEQEA
ncbi:transketolase family protein [Fusibacter sp. JL298sf-3]